MTRRPIQPGDRVEHIGRKGAARLGRVKHIAQGPNGPLGPLPMAYVVFDGGEATLVALGYLAHVSAADV